MWWWQWWRRHLFSSFPYMFHFISISLSGRELPFLTNVTMLLLLQLYMFACFLMPAKGEVGNDFSKCNQFFFDNKPPDESLTPANPARICQVYKNVYRFATMYDRKNRIPIFSAYKCKPGKGPRPEDWMIEPQVRGHPICSIQENENCLSSISPCSSRIILLACLPITRSHSNPLRLDACTRWSKLDYLQVVHVIWWWQTKFHSPHLHFFL